MLTDHTIYARTVLVAALVLALAASALAGATAAQTEPTVRVADAELTPGGTATADIVLTSAPDGLAGYAVEVRVDGDATEITGASYPESFGLTSEPAIADDGASVTLEAADLNEEIEPGDADVVLATVELNGLSNGDARLSVEPLQFDSDAGGSMSPATTAGTVTISADSDGSADPDTGIDDSATSSAAVADSDTDGTGSSSGDETTSTTFALPAGGIALTALAVTLIAAFVARWRR